jgi:hypothetical protein
MPRGIPNKPKVDPKLTTGADTATRVYWCYVHGESINSIAEKFNLEVQDALEIINKAEEAKG